ncbi:hypothetical protein Tco_0541340 [Tanacetum coccineum]
MTTEKCLKIVGYEADVQTAIKFAIKNLTQTWKTLLIWNDLVYQVNQSAYKPVQYPCYVKLIINHVFGTYLNIPKRVKEPYHYIRDGDPILNMFTTSNPSTVPAIRIPDELLTDNIKDTEAYKDCDADYKSVTKAHHVTIAMDVNAKEAEAKENVAIIEKVIMFKEVDKTVEGEEKEDESESYDSYLLSQEDFDTRMEPESHKESSMETANVDDDHYIDDDQHNVDALIRKKKKDCSEIRDEEKQTPIPTPLRSPGTNLSSDKEHNDELTETNIHVSNVPYVFSHAKRLVETRSGDE